MKVENIRYVLVSCFVYSFSLGSRLDFGFGFFCIQHIAKRFESLCHGSMFNGSCKDTVSVTPK